MIWLDEGGRQRHVRLIAPPPILRGAVEHFWIHERLPRNTWRVVPDLSPHVIFSMTRQGVLTADCRIVGARSKFCDIDMEGRELTIGVRLEPGVLPHLVRDSAAHLHDRSEPVQDVFGSAARDIVERMAEAPRDCQLRLLAEFLSSRLTTSRPAWPSGARSVTDLARAWSISRRAAYNRTLDTIGLPPKLALRVSRLHTALFFLDAETSLAAVATRAGYADQSHFTRESARLLGQTPAEWRRRGCSFVQDAHQ